MNDPIGFVGLRCANPTYDTTILIVGSEPSQKDPMIRLVLNLLGDERA